MSWISQLGSKIPSYYQMGKKALDQAIGLGHKIKSFAMSDPVQTVYRMLPPRLQMPIGAVAMAGEKALQGLEKLQSKINTGEELAGRVKKAYETAKSVELPRQPIVNTPEAMEQGSSIRIPDKMVTGGSRREEITTTTNMRGPVGPSLSPMMF